MQTIQLEFLTIVLSIAWMGMQCSNRQQIKPIADHAQDYRKYVFNAMEELRKDVDALEMITASKQWPYPSYGDILFSIR